MTLKGIRKYDLIVGSLLIFLLRPTSILLGTLLRRNHDLTIRKQLAIMKIRGGGSLLLALPALLALRKKYPDKKFTLVTSAEVKPFAELMGVFNEIVVINTNSLPATFLTALFALTKVWRADGFVNFEIHSKLSTVFSCFSCARNRFGFYHETNSFQRDVITHLFFYNITSPVYINYNQVALALGAEVLPYKEVSEFFVQRNNLKTNLKNEDTLKIVLAPFCSDLGREREFSPQHWASILKEKGERKKIIVTILGGIGDLNRACSMECQLKTELANATIINQAGRTSLLDSARIIRSANEFYTIDSGLNHIARLIGGSIQITSYWGPTDPMTRLAPYPDLNETIIYKKLFCSPCVHVVTIPPCKGNNICMKQYVEQNHGQYSTGGWLVVSNSATPKSV